MSFVTAIVLLIMLVLHVYAAMQFAEMAREKGFENVKTTILVLCILVPVAGYLLVCAMPDLKKRASMEKLIELMEAKNGGQVEMGDELPDL